MINALAAIPTGPVEVPPTVRELARGARLTPVWLNAVGGLTFRADDTSGSTRFIKWAAAGAPDTNLATEAERLSWAASAAARVPSVLDQGFDSSGSWLVTAALDAESAVSETWLAHPRVAARAIGAGLREFHDRLPVEECPFSWSIGDRTAQARRRRAAGDGVDSWSREHRGLDPDAAFARLAHPPAPDRLVVCHGDACAPNTLLSADGAFAGHVDLGDMGVADRWADLAVAAWSTEWNYGRGFADAVFAGYGITADDERIAYYRLLWDLS